MINTKTASNYLKTHLLKYYILTVLTILLFSCKERQDKINPVQYCSASKKDSTISITKTLQTVSQLMKQKTGVFVLEDGGTAITTRAWFCQYAEKTIDIQYFIFSTDNIGLIACDYLVRAADRGVKIRLLIDDIMVDAGFNDILKLDAHKNISIKIYNPGVNLGKNIFQKLKKFTTDFRSANQRMHNKTFIVDSKVVITGGRNIADEYFDYDHAYNFRDRDVLLLGKETKQVSRSFDLFWNSNLSQSPTTLIQDIPEVDNTKANYNKLHDYACNPANFWPEVRENIKRFPQYFNTLETSGQIVWTDSISFVSDFPGKNDGKSGLGGGGITTSKLLKLVKSAKKSITIQTPYLITSDLGKNLFKKAVSRGVSITILTNSLASTDNLEAFSSYQTDRAALLNTGVNIYECKPDAAIRSQLMTGALQKQMNFTPVFGLHAKSMIIDNHITVIGTFNLDPRSANLNTECITVINNKAIAKSVLKGINEELLPENAWKITTEFNPDHEVSAIKRAKTWSRKILPKDIL